MTFKLKACERLKSHKVQAADMTYEEALKLKQAAEKATKDTGDHLTRICEPHKGGPLGLTSDEFRNTGEYKKAKMDFDRAFENERRINTWFLKNKEFKKRYSADRYNRLASRK